MNVEAIWHELECGRYRADLELWRELARTHGDPVLDVGAGAGRVALDLADQGFRVTALDRDPGLLAELAQRAQAAGLDVPTVLADAREFELDERFALCVVPMQTIQLLGGAAGRAAFLRRAHRHLAGGGRVAIAIAEELETYEPLHPSQLPLPDMCELDGVVYSSQPQAIREHEGGFVLERRREIVDAHGGRTVQDDAVHLDRLLPAQLERESEAVGLLASERLLVAPTQEYSGSTVVVLRG